MFHDRHAVSTTHSIVGGIIGRSIALGLSLDGNALAVIRLGRGGRHGGVVDRLTSSIKKHILECPFAAVLDVLRAGAIGATAPVPPVAMLTFGIALVAGLWFIGKEVMATVGHHLTTIHPASGFESRTGSQPSLGFAELRLGRQSRP